MSVIKDKLNATLIHFAITAVIVGTVFILIFFYWYPKPFFEANGASTVLRILVGVDLILGPLLTLALYKKGKKNLFFDMSVIAAIQLAALVYGTSVIYQGRPYYLVFAVDRFEIVGKDEIDATKIKYPELKIKPNKGPIMVFTDLPEDPKERENLFYEFVAGAPDIERRPKYYQPYLPNLEKVFSRAKSLDILVQDNEKNKEKIDIFLKKYSASKENLIYYPLVGRNNSLVLVLDKTSGMPIDGISINPWLDQ